MFEVKRLENRWTLLRLIEPVDCSGNAERCCCTIDSRYLESPPPTLWAAANWRELSSAGSP